MGSQGTFHEQERAKSRRSIMLAGSRSDLEMGDSKFWKKQEGSCYNTSPLRERSRGLTCHCGYGKKEKGKIPHSIHVPFVAFISGKLPSSKRGPSCCGPVALPCEPTNSSFTHKPQNHRRSLNSLLPSVIYCSSLWKSVAHPTSMTFVLYTSCIIFFNGQVWS